MDHKVSNKLVAGEVYYTAESLADIADMLEACAEREAHHADISILQRSKVIHTTEAQVYRRVARMLRNTTIKGDS